jgi:hypothetical protein
MTEIRVLWNGHQGNLWAQVAQDGTRFILNVTDKTIAWHPSRYVKVFTSADAAIEAGCAYLEGRDEGLID